MTILQMVLILVIFQWAFCVREEPVRDRECSHRSWRQNWLLSIGSHRAYAVMIPRTPRPECSLPRRRTEA
jgi:hypothetical protein